MTNRVVEFCRLHRDAEALRLQLDLDSLVEGVKGLSMELHGQ